MFRVTTLLFALLIVCGQSSRADDEQETTTENGSREDKVMKLPTGGSAAHRDRGEVSETDVYLLSAIEKLAYRLDFFEKRLRRTEDLIVHVMSSHQPGDKSDPCPANFTRTAAGCYYFSDAKKGIVNWQAASEACKTMGGALIELESVEETQDLVTHIKSTPGLKDKGYWTGGLNPGLLWIWADSGRPVANTANPNKKPGSQNKPQQTIRGNGRCLLMAYDAGLRSYNLVGSDCSRRQNYVCEAQDNVASRALERIQRNLRLGNLTATP